MRRKNPKVDGFLSKASKWQGEFRKLRTIVLDCGLNEELKWRLPCYTIDGSNIAIIRGFKEYCALMFFKGALLRDPKGLLVAPGNSQAGRQVRFTNVQEIADAEPVLRAYIREAIKIEKAGLKVKMKKTAEYEVPVEFQSKLDASPSLKMAFDALTPGRQRAYIYHFSQPKQSKTRESRVEKSVPRIMKGKGLNDPQTIRVQDARPGNAGSRFPAAEFSVRKGWRTGRECGRRSLRERPKGQYTRTDQRGSMPTSWGLNQTLTSYRTVLIHGLGNFKLPHPRMTVEPRPLHR